MPSKVVYKILGELGEDKFDGTICFHIYNEQTFLWIRECMQDVFESFAG